MMRQSANSAGAHRYRVVDVFTDQPLEGNALAVFPNAAGLGAATPQLLSAGNPTVFIPLKDKDAVDRARMDAPGCAVLKGGDPEPLCVFVFTPTPAGADSRMFATDDGVAEDPATGSSTGPLAVFMMRHGLVSGAAGARFISEQGTKMKRRSILHIHLFGDQGRDGVDVGGQVTPVAEATLRF